MAERILPAVYFALPCGWGWLPVSDLPEGWESLAASARKVLSDEIYRSEPGSAPDDREDRDLLPTLGLDLSRRKITPDTIKQFITGQWSVCPYLVDDPPSGISQGAADRGDLDHGDLTGEESASLDLLDRSMTPKGGE